MVISRKTYSDAASMLQGATIVGRLSGIVNSTEKSYKPNHSAAVYRLSHYLLLYAGSGNKINRILR